MVSEPTPLDWDAIAHVNTNLSERLYEEGVELFYDREADTLFVTIGRDKGAITEQVIDTVYIRVDPETNVISGYTLLRFESNLLANNALLRKAFEPIYEKLVKRGDPISWKGAVAERAGPILKALVPAGSAYGASVTP